MQPQPGDILLVKGKEIASLMIRELTADGVPFADSYSHCGIYAGNGMVYDARLPTIGLYKLDYGEYDIRRVSMTEAQKAQLFTYCEKSKGMKYALHGVIDAGIEEIFHIPVGIHLNGEKWCSLFVNTAFSNIGIPLTFKPYPVPNDIAWSVIPQKVS